MRIRALIIRILRQFWHDKRTLALMIVAPMLVLLLMSLVFNGEPYRPEIAVVQAPDSFVRKLEQSDAIVRRYSAEEAERALADARIDAIVSIEGGAPSVRLEGSDPSANKAVLLLLQHAVRALNPAAASAEPAVAYLHGSASMAAFDHFGPVLIGFFVFFFVFLLSGVSFLRERTGGTLERLLASPLRRWEIVVGYVTGFGLFTTIQSALIAWFAIDVLDMRMAGSFVYVLLVTLLLAVTALTFGTFLSAFANNEFQMIQFIPLVIVPQVFFSGLFNMDTMAEWLRWIGRLMPLSYGADALRDIMIRGKGWADIATDVYVLLGFSAVVLVLNVFALKKHRRI
ncbi:ABC transporter permease [Paenibacillus flagellatus]|uniref:ABC transporter permease n=1 Tax=Paenibacillus flagellatus TaxID=2211139 RepID=A0A2V5K534_9BACL|nr:ABC transporter permease [Paenibacillus flagellatus]PYI54459.1 ABC transporter permease [Paenibacillus flagellatus]